MNREGRLIDTATRIRPSRRREIQVKRKTSWTPLFGLIVAIVLIIVMNMINWSVYKKYEPLFIGLIGLIAGFIAWIPAFMMLNKDERSVEYNETNFKPLVYTGVPATIISIITGIIIFIQSEIEKKKTSKLIQSLFAFSLGFNSPPIFAFLMYAGNDIAMMSYATTMPH